MKHLIRTLTCLILLAAPLLAPAYELTPTASTGAIYTDNVARGSTNVQSDTALDVTAGLAFHSDTRTLLADVKASDLFRYYVNNTFSSVHLPSVLGTVDWNIAPGHFSWWFEDEYGQIAPDPFYTIDPTQLRDTNFASTGPTITLPIGQTNSFQIGGTYSAVSYADSDIDSNRLRGTASLGHDFSPLRRLSLNYVREEVKFKHDELYPSYSEQAAFLRLTSNVRVMSLILEAGAAAFESATQPRQTEPVGDLTMYRRIGAVTTVGFDIGRRFSDSAEAFRFDALSETHGSGASNVPLSASPFLEDSFSAFVNVDRLRDSFRASVSQNHRKAVVAGEPSLRISEVALQGVFRVNARDAMGAKLEYERNEDEFPTGNQVSNNYWLGLQASHLLSRSTQVSLAYDRYMRRTYGEFTENRVTLTLTYAPVPASGVAAFAPYRGRNIQPPPPTGTPGVSTDPSRDTTNL